MAETKNRELSIVVTVAIVLTFAAIDFIVPAILKTIEGPSEWLGILIAALAYGVFMAQLALIATWAVFARVNIVLRLSTWLLFGLATWYILILDLRNAGEKAQPIEVAGIGVFLLLCATFLQVPLWISKLAFRYRMLMPDEVPVPVSRERLQFQVRDLLIATLIVAVAMSPIRLVLPKEGIDNSWISPEAAIEMLVAIGIISIVTLPSLWAAFASRTTIVAAIALAIYSLIISGIEFGLVWAFARPAPPGTADIAEGLGLACTGNLAQAAIVFGVMRIYYALGYRLRRVPRKAPPLAEVSIDAK